MVKAYFTVEAACILPMVLGVYVFLIYVMFYQYDRCLLEQDAVRLAMDEGETANRDKELYLAFEAGEETVKRGIGKTDVRMDGLVEVPFHWMKEWLTEAGWKIETTCSVRKIQPAKWIRLYKNIVEGDENASD